jgi:hypothetical protein
MKKIVIEVEKHSPGRPNEWRVKLFVDDEPPIQEVINTSHLPQHISTELVNLLAKRGSS